MNQPPPKRRKNEDWTERKNEIERSLIDSGYPLPRSTAELDEFWSFLSKFQQKCRTSRTTSASEEMISKLNLGKIKPHGIKFNVGDKELEVGLLLFLDFTQKRSEERRNKIIKDQQSLPIFPFKRQIIETVASNSVTIIAAQTGAGKSTQIPQFLASDTRFKSILVTQPRRIACMSLCRRVSVETFDEYGSQVAFQIRFENTATKDTRILFLTEGILLRMLSADSNLSRFDVVILDEVHERHLTTDFAMGILKKLIEKRRSDLHLVLMSATINVKMFSEYFKNAPIITIPGKLFPVETIFVSDGNESFDERSLENGNLVELSQNRLDPRPYISILEKIDETVPQNERGDVLVFLSGIKEILTLSESARIYASKTKRWIILLLHSSLSVEEQDKVFDIAPLGVRKLILSTNIAETSVTIDGIRFIIDSGKERMMGYDSNTRTSRLQEYWISKASANQRSGRAGRTGPGVCYRVYSRAEFNHFYDFSIPEIHRVPLEGLILQMLELKLGDPRSFEFIQPPPIESIETAINRLKEIDAIISQEQKVTEELTSIGKLLAKLPVDPQIGKVLILAKLFDALETALIIASGLTVQSPFVRVRSSSATLESQETEHKTEHSKFLSQFGDPFTLLNLYNAWIDIKVKGTHERSSRSWCREHFLEEQRLYEMTKLISQFKQLLNYKEITNEETEEINGSADENESFVRMLREERKKKLQIQRDLQLLRMEKERKRKRRMLHLETDEKEQEGKESDEEGVLDIRDIDFKMTHDTNSLLKEIERGISSEEMEIVKFVVCCGLYPNIAVPDEYSALGTGVLAGERLYHTKYSEFVCMHPSSVFGPRGETICQGDALFFVSLVHTTKPFISNVMKVTAINTLLLIARKIDTDKTAQRIIIDEWLEVIFANQKIAENILLKVSELRNLLKLAQENDTTNSPTKEENNERPENIPEFISKIWKSDKRSVPISNKQLGKDIAIFLSVLISHKMRRLRGYEIRSIFTQKQKQQQQSTTNSDDDPMKMLEESLETKTKQKGIWITNWLHFDSIPDSQALVGSSEYLQNPWKCLICNKAFMFSSQQIQEHQKCCSNQFALQN